VDDDVPPDAGEPADALDAREQRRRGDAARGARRRDAGRPDTDEGEHRRRGHRRRHRGGHRLGGPVGADGEEELVDDPWTRPGEWYVVHTQSGYEKKVTANLHARIQSMNMEEQIFEVVIPMEEVVEFKGGASRSSSARSSPATCSCAAACPTSPGTASATRRASPGSSARAARARSRRRCPGREVRTFLAVKGDQAEQTARAKPRLEYEVGESVRVKEGPFADFSGEIA
jgi:transcriptional antiterminator NusG